MILFELIVTNFSVARDFILPASDFDWTENDFIWTVREFVELLMLLFE
jgi:hypothetical protein